MTHVERDDDDDDDVPCFSLFIHILFSFFYLFFFFFFFVSICTLHHALQETFTHFIHLYTYIHFDLKNHEADMFDLVVSFLRPLDALDVGTKFVQGLNIFFIRIRVKDDATASLKVRDCILNHHSAQCDACVHFSFDNRRPILAGLVISEVPDGTGIYPPFLALELSDKLHSPYFGCAGCSTSGEYGPKGVESRFLGSQHTGNLRDQMLYMGKLLDSHEEVDLRGCRVAYAVDVIPC